MKSSILLTALGIFGFAACQSASKTSTAETTAAAPDSTTEVKANETVCYLLTEGNENQDSTFVRLQFDGTHVTGNMDWQPWEKDGAYGTIEATEKDGIIRGLFAYTIEGSQQTEEVIFKLQANGLYKGEGELYEKPGKDVILLLKDPESVTFSQKFTIVPCLHTF